MRQFAFRAALDVAAFPNRTAILAPIYEAYNISVNMSEATANWTQRVPYKNDERRTVYSTNPVYLALAVVVSLVGVLAVLPLYYGWWELGRPVSLNPLETGKAFGAPLFEGMNSNTHRSHILKQVGHEQVRYGVVEDKTEDESTCQLLIDIDHDDARLSKPRPGATFS